MEMGDINWLAVVLGAVAFFAVGAVWYSFLFSKVWQRETALTEEQQKSFNMPLTFGLCFLAELVIAATVGHMFAYLHPDDHAKLMITIGVGLAVMAPAIGINYLFMRKSLKLWLIDAGHFVVGMAALGLVFVLLG
jgi:hypothetical protein